MQSLGPFRLLRLLGKGGMGRVYLAEDQRSHSQVALKFLRPQLQDEQSRSFFRGEVALLSRLSNPHLVKIYDFFESDGVQRSKQKLSYFSMEYVDGLRLDELPKPVSFETALEITVQFCQGLQYLHSRQILHRDLKPTNAFWTHAGQLKIVDFGLSAATQISTEPGLGTWSYLPPEAFSGGYDMLSDLFSLGVLLYEILSEQLPYSEPLLQLSKIEPALPLGKLRPDLPEFFSGLIDRLIEPHPSRRPTSAPSVIRFLNHHLDKPYPILAAEGIRSSLQKIPWVERKEFSRILEALEQPRPGSPPLFLHLSGPTGVGRTRLLEELKWSYQLKGGDYLGTPPSLASRWLKSAFEHFGENRSGSGNGHFLGECRDFLKNFAARPCVLAFQDLQDWPEHEISLLEQFFRIGATYSLPWIFILEWNQDPPWPAGKRLLDFTRSQVPQLSIELKDLGPEQTHEMLTLATLESPLPKEIQKKIESSSGGRPLLLIEELRHHLQGDERSGRLEASPPDALSPLQQMAYLRTRQLSEEAQRLLAILVTHPEALRWESARALSQASAKPEDARLELDAQDFTRFTKAGDHEFGLAHPSLRESYRTELSPQLLESTHRRWIEYLDGPGKDIWEDAFRIPLLAEHAWRAHAIAETERWGPEAAQIFLDRGDLQAALEWYDRMLSLASAPATRAFYEAHRAPLLYRLGRWDEALAAYARWLAETTDDGSALQQVKYQLYTGQTQVAAGREAEGKKALEICLKTGDAEVYPKHRFYHARAHVLLSGLEEKQGDVSRARHHLEEALRLSAQHPGVLGEVHQRLGALQQNQLECSKALDHYQKSLELHRQVGNIHSEAIAHNSIGMLYREQGNIRDAEAALKRAEALAMSCGEIRQLGSYLENLALIQMDMAHYSTALPAMEEAQKILEPLGDPGDRFLLLLHRAQLYLFSGNFDQADRLLTGLGKDPGVQTGPGLWSTFFHLLAERHYLAGDWEESEKQFSQSLEFAREEKRKPEALWAQLGLLRCTLRQGRPLSAHLDETLEGLKGLAGPLSKLETRLLQALAPTVPASPELLLETLGWVEEFELPETRLEFYSLLALRLHQWGEVSLAEDVEQICRLEWNYIFHLVPEELKMDFEKNRFLQKAAQATQELIEKKKKNLPGSAPLELPVAAEAGPPASPAISEMRFRQFSEINRQILQKSSLGEILDAVMDAALELSRAERGFFLLKGESALPSPIPGFEIKAARLFNSLSLDQKEPSFSMTTVEEAIRQGTFILTDNAQLDPRFRGKQSVAAFNLKSILVVPLEVQGKILGVLYLDHRYQPNCFTPEDVTLVTRFSFLAALAIERTQLLEDLREAKKKLEGQVQAQAQKIADLSGQLANVREDLKFGYEEIVGQSPAMMRVFQQLDHVTETTIPVWIWGESGTGKEMIAHSLHFNSSRKAGPFVAENVSAIPETLVESELFGHKKGAFTHADRDRIGLFEQADGGTLFLDEIADMSLAMQAKLLRVLQEGEIRPVGANKKIKIDVRLVTASNRDLKQLVKEGKFRQDLFFRINGLTLKLPPLRERKEDIPILVNHLIKKIAREFKLQASDITDETLHLFLRYEWPGNVRELEGVLRNALLFAKGRPITTELLAANETLLKEPELIQSRSGETSAPPTEEHRAERQIILEALRRHQLDKKSTALELGISLRNLYVRMDRHGIPKKKTVLSKYLGI